MRKLPDHLFIADGHLFDTRDPNWTTGRPLRPSYRFAVGTMTTGRGVKSLQQVKAALRFGPTTDLGGYPMYFVTRDGAALSFEAARDQFAQVCGDHLDDTSTGWRIDAIAINYEDGDLRCDHTGKAIPSAYAEDAA